MSSKHKSRRSSVKWKDVFGKAAYRLIEFGAPNNDGIVVQRHQADSKPDVHGVLSTPDDMFNIRYEEIAAMGKPIFMSDGIYITVTPWPGPRGDLMRDALQVGCDIIPVGTGCVDENGYVWDYRLLYFYIDIFAHGNEKRNPI